nr:hypothetical protein [Tanacetum cinerariifolium]
MNCTELLTQKTDLFSFIWTVDPTKVRVAERQRAKDEPMLIETTVRRVVLLLPVAPARASSELEASDVASLQPRPQRKRKTVVADASGPSHPPKKSREDYRALGGAFTAGKSRSVVQILFTEVVLNAEARGEPILTLPFVTSSVSATPEREEKSHADFITGLNLRTIGALQRFVISSDSSHHSGANIAEAEVDSIVRSFAPAIATVTTVTAVVDAATTADRVPVEPSLFGVGSSSTGRTDSAPGGFSDVSGSDFLIGDKFSPPKFFASIHGMDHNQLFNEFNVGATRQISLSAEVRMRAEYNIREKRRLRSVVDEQAELLKGEVVVLRDHSATLEKETNDLSVKVTDLLASVKVREKEVADLDTQVTAVRLQNDNLVGPVHELEISSVGLQEKVVVYEDFIGQLEKFQDEKMEEVNEKFNKLCADFVKMALHLKEKFYPHLLTTISGSQWLLTHGMELAIVKCLNSTEYLSALGAAISKAVEKICRKDYLLGLPMVHKRLQNVNFSLIAELKSNKDASVDTIMNLLRLDDTLAERKIRENISSHVSAFCGVFVPLSVAALEGTIPPISTDDYEVAHVDGQEGASVDGKTIADENNNPFSDVSNAELNILELQIFHVRGRVYPLRSLSLYALFPNASMTLYSPSYLACSLFSSKRSKMMSKASLFLTISTSAVLKAVGLGMFNGGTISSRKPNLHTILSHTNFLTWAPVMVATGLASIHLCKLLAVASLIFWQWQQPSMVVRTYTASGNSILAVGMPCAFYSQQSSPKLDAPSALKFSRIK